MEKQNNMESTSHHKHINFSALMLSTLGVGIMTIGVFTLGASAKNSAPSVIAISHIITPAEISDRQNQPVVALTTVSIKETEFYSSVTIIPE